MSMEKNPVTLALQAMKAGTGTFEDVKAAVDNFTFTPLPAPPTTLAGLWEQEDYVVEPHSFRDIVFGAMFDKTLTPDQFEVLRELELQKKGKKLA